MTSRRFVITAEWIRRFESRRIAEEQKERVRLAEQAWAEGLLQRREAAAALAAKHRLANGVVVVLTAPQRVLSSREELAAVGRHYMW